jgi:hypothetical protein
MPIILFMNGEIEIIPRFGGKFHFSQTECHIRTFPGNQSGAGIRVERGMSFRESRDSMRGISHAGSQGGIPHAKR